MSARKVRDWTARIVLWGAVGLLLLIGLIDLLTPPPSAGHELTAGAAARQEWPDDHARTVAQAFAQTYLTWNPRQPDNYQWRVAAYLPSDVTPPTLPAKGPGQVVTETMVEGVARTGRDTALITVAALTEPGRWEYLTVPITRTPAGTVAVSDNPSFASAPARTSLDQSNPDSLQDPGADQIEYIATQFVRAYLAGDIAGLAAWSKPGVRSRAAATPKTMVGQPTVGQTGPTSSTSRTVVVDAEAKDAAGVIFPVRYWLRMEHGDRWWVAQIDQEGR